MNISSFNTSDVSVEFYHDNDSIECNKRFQYFRCFGWILLLYLYTSADILCFNTSDVSVEFIYHPFFHKFDVKFQYFRCFGWIIEINKAEASNPRVSILQMFRLNWKFGLKIEGVEKVSILQMFRLNYLNWLFFGKRQKSFNTSDVSVELS